MEADASVVITAESVAVSCALDFAGELVCKSVKSKGEYDQRYERTHQTVSRTTRHDAGFQPDNLQKRSYSSGWTSFKGGGQRRSLALECCIALSVLLGPIASDHPNNCVNRGKQPKRSARDGTPRSRMLKWDCLRVPAPRKPSRV